MRLFHALTLIITLLLSFCILQACSDDSEKSQVSTKPATGDEIVAPGDVIARVGDQTITYSELSTMMNSSAMVGLSIPALGTPERNKAMITLLDKAISANLLYLDAKEKRYIDESGPANFFGITVDGQYVTPQSESVLPSITNMSIITLAEEMGLRPERRKIDVEEIFSFREAGCCGTAAVITPVGSITYGDRKAVYSEDGDQVIYGYLGQVFRYCHFQQLHRSFLRCLPTWTG